MKKQHLLFLRIPVILVAGLFFLLMTACKSTTGPEEYLPGWESLKKHEAAPEWLKDAKFGIYFHWGVYSVPAFGNEWYPRWMHFEGTSEYNHHLETYGHPSEFGYHDFVPMFKAENFDAEEWSELFVKAGARFAGPVAEHHDGFAMWDSKATPWNARDMGPKRDITGELEAAIKKRGLKFITTFHHSKNLQRYDSISVDEEDPGYRMSHYPYFRGMPPASDDKRLQYLYGNIEEEKWLKEVWFEKLKEVVDQYQPDIMWFDYALTEIPEALKAEYCACYLNAALKWGKEVAIVCKNNALPIEFTIDDLEKSRKNILEKKLWMTDETISTGSWCYTENLGIKASEDILHVLIDIVSKNGVLLLNISPKADGTIPDNQREVLLDMGEWLGKYGEAIYGTRPWYTFGEGPTKEPEGDFKFHKEFLKIKYSPADIRYTTRENYVYACFLGVPEKGKALTLEAFGPGNSDTAIDISEITLLGSDEKVTWEMTGEGLSLILPQTKLDDMAVVLKIETSA